MKIAFSQLNYHVGNFEANTHRIIERVKEAETMGAELIVFTELSVCGYPPQDFLEFNDFINRCYAAVDQIAHHSKNIGVLLGSPVRNPDEKGKPLFNAAWLLYQGKVQAIQHKTLLPTYDVFDEYRYFEPGYAWKVMEFKGYKLAVTICEDIWSLGDNPLYRTCPMDMLIGQEPDMMINISASPFDYARGEERLNLVRANVSKYQLPMLYCNAVGAQTEIIFDGGSLVMNADQSVVQALPFFEEGLAYVEFTGKAFEAAGAAGEATASPAVIVHAGAAGAQASALARVTERMIQANSDDFSRTDIERLHPELHTDRIHDALVLGIGDYFRKMGFSKAIIGSSGGIDSALTLALASEALGPQHVRAVLMPSPYSTEHSVADAVELAKRLGNPYDIVPIKEVYEAFLHTLHPLFGDLPFSLAEENIQSRSRGNILMSIANKFGYILLNTSNKSELSTGYGTLYGDMAGGLGVLGDLYKLQVYFLSRYINRNQEIIPQNIIEKAPSAELRPDQKDTDSLPDYSILDPILYQYIERRQGPGEIVAQGFEPALVARILKMVNAAEYKRKQFCPIIRVSPKAFGVGRRLPIVARYLG
jgi:NAD+ synthase (glutamine-hydrolysing)